MRSLTIFIDAVTIDSTLVHPDTPRGIIQNPTNSLIGPEMLKCGPNTPSQLVFHNRKSKSKSRVNAYGKDLRPSSRSKSKWFVAPSTGSRVISVQRKALKLYQVIEHILYIYRGRVSNLRLDHPPASDANDTKSGLLLISYIGSSIPAKPIGPLLAALHRLLWYKQNKQQKQV
jgi:hypothetical protein